VCSLSRWRASFAGYNSYLRHFRLGIGMKVDKSRGISPFSKLSSSWPYSAASPFTRMRGAMQNAMMRNIYGRRTRH
jgi:hypothetical protein